MLQLEDEGIGVGSSGGTDGSRTESLHPDIAAITRGRSSIMRHLGEHGTCQLLGAGEGHRLVVGIADSSFDEEVKTHKSTDEAFELDSKGNPIGIEVDEQVRSRVRSILAAFGRNC